MSQGYGTSSQTLYLIINKLVNGGIGKGTTHWEDTALDILRKIVDGTSRCELLETLLDCTDGKYNAAKTATCQAFCNLLGEINLNLDDSNLLRLAGTNKLPIFVMLIDSAKFFAAKRKLENLFRRFNDDPQGVARTCGLDPNDPGDLDIMNGFRANA